MYHISVYTVPVKVSTVSDKLVQPVSTAAVSRPVSKPGSLLKCGKSLLKNPPNKRKHDAASPAVSSYQWESQHVVFRNASHSNFPTTIVVLPLDSNDVKKSRIYLNSSRKVVLLETENSKSSTIVQANGSEHCKLDLTDANYYAPGINLDSNELKITDVDLKETYQNSKEWNYSNTNNANLCQSDCMYLDPSNSISKTNNGFEDQNMSTTESVDSIVPSSNSMLDTKNADLDLNNDNLDSNNDNLESNNENLNSKNDNLDSNNDNLESNQSCSNSNNASLGSNDRVLSDASLDSSDSDPDSSDSGLESNIARPDSSNIVLDSRITNLASNSTNLDSSSANLDSKGPEVGGLYWSDINAEFSNEVEI